MTETATPQQSPSLEIVSSSTCPFAQRTRMVLIEKGLPFTLTEISLDDKPDWFLALSPYGKVPLLKHGEAVIFESAVINEYLEEVFPDPPLMPRDPVERADMRIWVDFANVRFIPHVYKLMMAQEEDDQRRQMAHLDEALRRFEERLSDPRAGPYLFGDRPTLADLSFYPHLERFCAVEHYRGYRVPAECRRVSAWLEVMSRRPSARTLRRPDEVYIRNWRKYARGGGEGATARDMRAM